MEKPLKNILVVAYYAPPSNASGTFRTLAFIRHLYKLGWKTTLLTVTAANNEIAQNTLTCNLPPSTRIVRAVDLNCFQLWAKVRDKIGNEKKRKESKLLQDYSASSTPLGWWNTIKECITTFLKTPDLQTGWLGPAIIRCLFLPKPDLIYSSAPPFTGHLIGVFCKYFWGLPLVCDFRDPWIDNPFRKPKPLFINRWDRWLECFVLSRADLVVVNTEKVASIFCKKNLRTLPKIAVIPNGYDPEDFVDIVPLRACPQDNLLLVHAGLLYGERDPINFLKALHALREQNFCPRLQVLLIGSSASVGGLSLEERIDKMGLGALVQTHPPVPHAEALSIMKGADALLLLALGTTLQVPAKLFEYFGLQKPVLSIAEKGSATEEITVHFPGLIYPAHNEPGSIQIAIRTLYNTWEEEGGKQKVRESSEALLRPMQRKQQAKMLAKHFSDLTNKEKS